MLAQRGEGGGVEREWVSAQCYDSTQHIYQSLNVTLWARWVSGKTQLFFTLESVRAIHSDGPVQTFELRSLCKQSLVLLKGVAETDVNRKFISVYNIMVFDIICARAYSKQIFLKLICSWNPCSFGVFFDKAEYKAWQHNFLFYWLQTIRNFRFHHRLGSDVNF